MKVNKDPKDFPVKWRDPIEGQEEMFEVEAEPDKPTHRRNPYKPWRAGPQDK